MKELYLRVYLPGMVTSNDVVLEKLNDVSKEKLQQEDIIKKLKLKYIRKAQDYRHLFLRVRRNKNEGKN
jgi:hypothetical protein